MKKNIDQISEKNISNIYQKLMIGLMKNLLKKIIYLNWNKAIKNLHNSEKIKGIINQIVIEE